MMNSRKKRSAVAVSAVAALALIGGVAAQFTTSTTSAPQQIGTGTMALSLDNVAPTVWTDPIGNLAAGDSVERFVDLRNAGSLKFSAINASQTNTLGDLLTAPSDIKVKFLGCSVAWNTTTGVCSTGAVDVMGSTSVRGWTGQLPMKTFEDFGAGEVRHLKVVTSLDATATNAVQGKNGTITYTFGGAQRAAGTAGSVSDSTTILGSPATISTTPSGTTASAATFSFTDPTNGKASYSVSWGETGNSAVAPQQTALALGATSYTLTGLKPNTSYDVALTAQLGVQKTVSTQTYATAVGAATGLATSGISSTGATVSWTDASAGKATYVLSYTTGSTTKQVSLPAGSTSTALTGLTSNATYSISLVATANGVSSAATTGSFSTLSGATSPQADGASDYLKLNETSGTKATNSPGYSSNGTYSNVSVGGMTGPDGVSKAAVFNGSTSKVAVPDSGAMTSGTGKAFSMEAWVSPTAGQTQKYIFGKGGNAWNMIYGFSGANQVEFFSGSYTGANPRTGTVMTVNPGVWSHVAYTYDGTTLRGYVNGVQQIAVTTTFTLTAVNSGGAVYIGGAGETSGNTFSGGIAGVAWAPKTFTADQIAAHKDNLAR